MFTPRLAGGTHVTSRPCNRIRPRSGVSNPAIIRRVVVLPHPDGPSIEKNEPPGISKETSFTATTSPKAFVTLSTTTSPPSGSAAGVGSVGSISSVLLDIDPVETGQAVRQEREPDRQHQQDEVERGAVPPVVRGEDQVVHGVPEHVG